MKILKQNLYLILFGIISFILFSFKLKSSVSFEGDLGRDLFEIAKISFGNFTLLGQKGSFGGIYAAPYYYYIFLLPFIIAGRKIEGILYFNVFLFVSALIFFTYSSIKKFGRLNGFLSGLTMMFLPFFIFAARNPGNGFTLTAFFIIFLTTIYFYDLNKFNLTKILLLGFFFGIILSTLFAYVTVFFAILLLMFFLLRNKKMLFVFIAGVFIAFLPLVVFELKNNFVMLKNTFVDRSYLSFVNNTNMPNGIKLNKNIFLNAVDLGDQIYLLIGVNIYSIFLFLISMVVWVKKFKGKIFVYASILGYIILIFIVRFQFSTHYLIPFLTFLMFVFSIAVLNGKFSKFFFIFVIPIFMLFFSKTNYATATRNYDLIKNRVDKVLSKRLIGKNDRFNIILKRTDDFPTPAGNEYRFFFLINGLEPESEFLYKDSAKLFIFSEEGDKNKINFKKFRTWEMSEFDLSKVKKVSSFKLDKRMTVYLLEK